MELPPEWQRNLFGPVPATHQHLALVAQELERTRQRRRVSRGIHHERDAGARRQLLDDRAHLGDVDRGNPEEDRRLTTVPARIGAQDVRPGPIEQRSGEDPDRSEAQDHHRLPQP